MKSFFIKGALLGALVTVPFSFLSIPASAQQTTSGFDTTNGLPLIFANQGQKVGEWNTTALIATGGVQVGQTTAACDATTAGQIRWNPATVVFEGCNGTIWQPLGGGEPTGEVAYFQLANCPTGWVPANGTGGIVDLRGEFIRGWDNGRGVDSGRVVASWQAATSISNITYDDLTIEFQNADSVTGGFWTPFDGFNCCGATSSWFTVRPRNVALLACEKS